MTDKVTTIQAFATQEDGAAWVSNLWDKYNNQRIKKRQDWAELREYLFATDTTHTSNASLPHNNKTTIPKLCQIRDNLHSNYISHLFPNDDWLRWAGYSAEDEVKVKKSNITAYMSNKFREGNQREIVSQLVYDYIDYGNAFATVTYESRYKTDASGQKVPGFVGPKMVRISPMDIVFDPTAVDFKYTPKVVRSLKTRGELLKLASMDPDEAFWLKVIAKRDQIRKALGGVSKEDFEKVSAYQIDGFGSLYEYLKGDQFEVLEYYGDYYDNKTDTLHTDRVITVVDRSTVVRDAPISSWFDHEPIYMVGWRKRPDNLWAMGPLDNLVGMQYRIDHLENMKADAVDMVVNPPLKIIGEVEEFVWGPASQIHIDENGDVSEVSRNLGGIITADNNIEALEARMELYAGAPREAMGMRSPGEKTAFEVQTLTTAAARIFQEKVNNFEINMLEPLLNAMLEVSVRLMDGSEVIRVADRTTGIDTFKTITKDDITSNGKLRPIGARHYSKQAQDLQNLIGVFNSPIGQMVMPHTSRLEMTKFIDDVIGLSNYKIFRENAGMYEDNQTRKVDVDLNAELENHAGMM